MKKSTLHLKWYFTVETSFYLEKNLLEIRIFSIGKDRFVRKMQVLTPKMRFSSAKEYFTYEIVFYSGNISFSREKLVEIRVFFQWK